MKLKEPISFYITAAALLFVMYGIPAMLLMAFLRGTGWKGVVIFLFVMGTWFRYTNPGKR